MAVPDDEIERIAPVVFTNCLLSGSCAVYHNGNSLSCVTGDRLLRLFERRDASDRDRIIEGIREALEHFG